MLINILQIFLILVGVSLFSFVLWRGLKHDYEADEIFSTSFFLLVSSATVGLLFSFFIPNFVFWGLFLGFVFAGSFRLWKFQFKFFEIVDSLSLGFFFILLVFYLSSFVKFGFGEAFLNLSYTLTFLFAIVVHKFLIARYRHFYWYPSGKVGFVGLATFVVYFFFRLVVALVYLEMLSLPWLWVDVGLSFLFFTLCFITIYLRSGRNMAEKLLEVLRRR